MPDCSSCKEARQHVEPVPYIVHEAAMARLERTIKRLWVLLLVVIALFVATNAGWLIYESQFEIVQTSTEIEQDTSGPGNNIVVGEIHGEPKSYDNYEIPDP